MKRIIALALIGAVVSGSVFAEITFSGWGTARWSPIVVGGDVETTDGKAEEVTNVGIGGGPGWKGFGAAVGFEVTGKNESETVGFNLHLRANNGTGDLGLGDPHAYIWSKPFGDILKVTLGLYDEDIFRGKFAEVNHGTSAVGTLTNNEDALFWRLRSGQGRDNTMGALIGLYPVDGLSIFANIGTSNAVGATPPKDAIADTLASGQYAIGYNISGIGLARFQFIGGYYGKSNNYSPLGGDAKGWNRLQLAFNLTAVDKLNIDVGATIPLALEATTEDTAVFVTTTDAYVGIVNGAPAIIPAKTSSFDITMIDGTKIGLADGDKYSPPIHIALGASYNLSPIVVQLRFDADLAESYEYKAGGKYESGAGIAFAIRPTYKLDGVGTLGVRVSLKLVGNGEKGGVDQKNGKTDLGLGAYFDRDIFKGCNFAIGLAASIPISGDGYDGDLNTATAAKAVAKAQAFKMSIPIMITYSL
jgi:hypothetical protein